MFGHLLIILNGHSCNINSLNIDMVNDVIISSDENRCVKFYNIDISDIITVSNNDSCKYDYNIINLK